MIRNWYNQIPNHVLFYNNRSCFLNTNDFSLRCCLGTNGIIMKLCEAKFDLGNTITMTLIGLYSWQMIVLLSANTVKTRWESLHTKYTWLRKKVKDDKRSGAGQVKLREGQQLRLDVLGFLGEHSTHSANMEMGRGSIDTELFAFYFCIFNTVVLLMLNVMFVLLAVWH